MRYKELSTYDKDEIIVALEQIGKAIEEVIEDAEDLNEALMPAYCIVRGTRSEEIRREDNAAT